LNAKEGREIEIEEGEDSFKTKRDTTCSNREGGGIGSFNNSMAVELSNDDV
jgi:hypothetical protein